MLFVANAIFAQDIRIFDGTSEDFRINAGPAWAYGYDTNNPTDKCPWSGDNCTLAVTSNVTRIVTINGGISSIDITLQNDGIYTVGAETYTFDKRQDTITLGEVDVPLETMGSTGTLRVNVVNAPYDFSRRVIRISL